MMQNLWKLFPQILEQKINHLLDEAGPSPAKAFQLYKTCKNENLWRNSFEIFSLHLQDFFSLAKRERAKSYFDNFLDRPMDRIIFDNFELNFRTAQVNTASLLEVATWSHEQMKTNCATDSVVVSVDVLTKTLQNITAPPLHEKDQNIEFEDFCITWKKTVFSLFGKKYDPEFTQIMKQIRQLNLELKKAEKNTHAEERHPAFVPGIYLTQTEIDWVSAVQKAAAEISAMPKYPLSRGAEKLRLVELERAIDLYNLVCDSRYPEMLKHRDNVRVTILDKCGWLLREKAR